MDLERKCFVKVVYHIELFWGSMDEQYLLGFVCVHSPTAVLSLQYFCHCISVPVFCYFCFYFINATKTSNYCVLCVNYYFLVLYN